MHMGLNGRDWLAQQLTKAGIAYRKQDNCFSWLADFAAAQRLADKQRQTNWPRLLERLGAPEPSAGEIVLAACRALLLDDGKRRVCDGHRFPFGRGVETYLSVAAS